MLQVLPVHNLLSLLGSGPQQTKLQKPQQNGFMSFLHRVGNTVNNNVVKPVERAISPQVQPPNFTPAPMQKLNLAEGETIKQLKPQIQTQPANDIRLNAQKNLQFTPAFTQNLVNAAPYSGKPEATSALTDQGGAMAEYLGHQVPNEIVLSNKSPDSADPSTILHEGLHRVYDTNPQVRKQFADAYNKSVKQTPLLKLYLTSRLYPYTGFAKGLDEGGVPIPNYDLSNIKNLPPHLQDEAHSFLSEMPSLGNRLPSPLAKYYANYFNSSNVRPPTGFANSHRKK